MEFQEWSTRLLKDIQSGFFSLYLSVLIDAEILNAPNEVKNYYMFFRECAQKILDLNSEAIELADAYIQHGILTHNFTDDARHIALATITNVDVLVSWNFKHIVHFDKIQKFNAINIELGHKPIQVYSPREVATYGNKNG
ncbi:MAG: hypothetical protein HZA78_07345 [Candidatus Schekmanbacteria bacterium]|nr:hypothetical protein [Candidatus Schekmanbacteria bacterium]